MPTTYNGWPNRETWLVFVWVMNDEQSYRYWREATRLIKRQKSTDSERLCALASQLERELGDADEPIKSGMLKDLAQHALGMVEWGKLAESLLEDE